MNTIVLINPPYSFWSPQKNYLRPFIGTFPSLGLLSLASALRKKKFDVKIVEGASLNWSFSQILREVVPEKPEFVGFGCTTASVGNGAKLAALLKERLPQTRTFIGGPHLTALPRQTLRCYPAFDYGVAGEGEMAFLEVLDAVAAGQNLETVASAVYREGETIRVNPRRRFIENLDELPFPAYDLLPFFPERYRPPLFNYLQGPTAPIAFSRGCPQACTFCDRSVFGNRYRSFSEDYLLDLISHLHGKYRVQHLVFVDDQFAARSLRLIRFCEKLLQRNLRISWNCDARADSLDQDMLHLMKKAGCWMVSYGVESGSQDILNSIRKDIEIRQIEQVVRWTKEAGIRAKGLFMIGYPQETVETLRQTLDLILRCPFDEINLSFLTPFPGTALYEQIKNTPGFLEDWDRMNALNPVFSPRRLSLEALEKAYSNIVRKFYMRPGPTFTYLRLLGRSPENRARLIRGLLQWLLFRLGFPPEGERENSLAPTSP